jgi:hypothetical protein
MGRVEASGAEESDLRLSNVTTLEGLGQLKKTYKILPTALTAVADILTKIGNLLTSELHCRIFVHCRKVREIFKIIISSSLRSEREN